MDLKTRIHMEIVSRRMIVASAVDRKRREVSEATREKRPLPRSRQDALDAEIYAARLNVRSAEASFEGVNKYPPLSWGV